MKDGDKEQDQSLIELARSYLDEGDSFPDSLYPDMRVRKIITDRVPEMEEFIRRLEEDAEEDGGCVTLWNYIYGLADTLFSAIEEKNIDLSFRCLQATEELLKYPSLHVRELVVEQIVESLSELPSEIYDLCGPRTVEQMGNL
ncbi:hypothetical protein Ppa06_63580 [Planomonospora parontospora subsp. parontospora]|uniref:DUF7674 domain-containing protein n=2 Tax=Planomonospora parontospora TaxID=58119 RepID=A0AA37BNR8_9ACTN|nr:hypothetical protein [Planomonospora parontospora]GGK97726.1 hypothetical protein GCM10010126_66430 [Planomonospora parontospora]GII12560.1 hypothetical protein Ppa06_63580 [Planomonospora parontospora subsp. parontospora]